MKKYLKEVIILIIQLFMFYIFPLFAGPTDAMGMVFLMLFATVLLSFILGIISEFRWKFFYPVAIAILFLPTIPVYYNISALVHALWYFSFSLIPLLLGALIRYLIEKIVK